MEIKKKENKNEIDNLNIIENEDEDDDTPFFVYKNI